MANVHDGTIILVSLDISEFDPQMYSATISSTDAHGGPKLLSRTEDPADQSVQCKLGSFNRDHKSKALTITDFEGKERTFSCSVKLFQDDVARTVLNGVFQGYSSAVNMTFGSDVADAGYLKLRRGSAESTESGYVLRHDQVHVGTSDGKTLGLRCQINLTAPGDHSIRFSSAPLWVKDPQWDIEIKVPNGEDPDNTFFQRLYYSAASLVDFWENRESNFASDAA